MPSSNGVKVKLSCDGESLREYGMETLGNETTCWVASKLGKAFVIHCKETGNVTSVKQASRLRSKLYVDGVLVNDSLIPLGNEFYAIDSYSQWLDKTTRKTFPFIFSNVTLTDDENLATNMVVDRVGAIEVEVFHVILTGPVHGGHLDLGQEKELPTILHEKSKKLMTHKATFGKESVRYDLRMQEVWTRPYDILNSGPIVRFKFLYRPHDFLRAQGIILDGPLRQSKENEAVPPPATGASSAGENTSSDKNTSTNKKSNSRVKEESDGHDEALESEINRLEKEQRVIQERLAKLKRKTENDGSSSKKVKKEKQDTPRFHYFKVNRDGVIDLTDD